MPGTTYSETSSRSRRCRVLRHQLHSSFDAFLNRRSIRRDVKTLFRVRMIPHHLCAKNRSSVIGRKVAPIIFEHLEIELFDESVRRIPSNQIDLALSKRAIGQRHIRSRAVAPGISIHKHSQVRCIRLRDQETPDRSLQAILALPQLHQKSASGRAVELQPCERVSRTCC